MATNFSEMSFPELRNHAKKLGLNVSGKKAPDLVRDIEKSMKAAKGKGTPADPKSGKTPTAAKGVAGKAVRPKARDEEEEEETVEVETDDNEDTTIADAIDAIAAVDTIVRALAKTVISLATELGAEDKVDSELIAYAEDDVSGADDDVEEEEEPVAKKSTAKKSAKAAVVEEEEEEETEEEEAGDDDEEETLEIDAAELDSAKLPRLQEIAKQINRATGEVTIDLKGVTSERVLRGRLKAYIEADGEVVADDEDAEEVEESDEEEETTSAKGLPDFIHEGGAVDVNFGEDDEEDWKRGVIQGVNVKKSIVDVTMDDGQEVEAKFSELRLAKKAGKAREEGAKKVVRKSA